MVKEKQCITQINPAQVTHALRSLLNPSDPASLRCFAVLDGTAKGRIFTNHIQNPTWTVVQETTFGSLYLGGEIMHPCLRRLISRLRRSGDVLVGLWQEDPRWSLLPSAPDYLGYTLEFTERDDHHSFPEIPNGCELRQLDRSLFKHILGKKFLISTYGSAEKALEGGYGLCLMKYGEILCETFAGPSASGFIEIGVESHPRHMRKGYATLTCSHLIQAMERRGYQTYWNCAKENQASIALAHKLGYRQEREYRLLAWSRLDA